MIRFSHEANSWLIYCGGYIWEKITPEQCRDYFDAGLCDVVDYIDVHYP